MKITRDSVRLDAAAALTQYVYNLPTNVIRLTAKTMSGGPIFYVDLTASTVAARGGRAMNAFTPYDSGELQPFTGALYYASEQARSSIILEITRAL